MRGFTPRLPYTAIRCYTFCVTESEIQKSIARALDSLGLFWCHVPNEGRRGARQLQRLLAEGLRPGMPDVLVFEPLRFDGVPYSGLALELKTKKGKATPRQLDCLDKLAQRGFLSATAHGLDAAIALLQRCEWQRMNATLVIDSDICGVELWRRKV